MHTATAFQATREPQQSILDGILAGYRFRFCDTPAEVRRTLDVRRAVYHGASGYRVPIPDEYDYRSWLLMAEDVATGRVVGTMRLTPRFAGALECEEYFALPHHLRVAAAYELNRFAILPEYRKGKTFIPVVSLGLYKLVRDFLVKVDARYMVIASKPERVWTYEWMRFRRSGQVVRYGKLEHAEHELLWHDFQTDAVERALDGHPFEEFFSVRTYDEVEVPDALPALDLVRPAIEPLRIGLGA